MKETVTPRAPGLEDSLIYSAAVRSKGTLLVGRRAGAFGQYLDPLKLHRGVQTGREPGSQAVCTLSDSDSVPSPERPSVLNQAE